MVYSLRSKMYWVSLLDKIYYKLDRKCKDSKSKHSPDVLLHIGTPKAGSSAIQHLCVSNRKKLFDQGFYYPAHPTDPNGVSGGHTVLSNALLEGQLEQGKEIFNKFLRESRIYRKTLFLSSEGFYRLRKDLVPMLSGLDVRILAWFRNPVESYISNHNQGIKRNYSLVRLEEECVRFCKSKAKFYLDGRELLAWGDEYGDDKCIFLPYTRFEPESVGVQQQLLNVLDIDPAVGNGFIYGNSCINASYSYEALELKRLLNSVLNEDAVWVNAAVDRYLQRYSDGKATRVTSGIQLTSDELLCMTQRFDEHVNRLVDRFKALEPVKNIELRPAIHSDESDSADMKKLIQKFMEENPKSGRWIYCRVQEKLKQRSSDETLNRLATLLDFKGISSGSQILNGIV